VFDKRKRWLVVGIMAIASLSLLGFAVAPLFMALQPGNPAVSASASPVVSPAAQQAELEAQAKGYEMVLQREPDNQTALRGLLEVKIQQRDLKGAIAPLEKLAKLNPDQPDITVLLAQTKQQVGDREGAAQAYRSILSSQPGNINALQGLVELLLQQQRPEAAVGLLQDTLRSAPNANQVNPGSIDVVSVQLLLGRVYAEQKRYGEAIAVYDQAIAADNQDFRPVLGKAIVLQQQGKQEEAKPLLATAANLAPPQYKDQINQLAQAPSPTAGATTPATPAPAAPATVPSPAPSP
jgi:tetratricopeptide (TPR) repeat protein